jgi:PAS domain S-box-containing protein
MADAADCSHVEADAAPLDAPKTNPSGGGSEAAVNTSTTEPKGHRWPGLHYRDLALPAAAAVALSAAASLALPHLPIVAAAALLTLLLLGFCALVLVRQRRRSAPMRVSFLTVQPKWHDQVPCYLTVLDRDLRIIDSNEMFRRDFGDRLGDPCYLAFKDRDHPCPNCAAQLTLQDGLIHTGDETVIRSDGRTMTVVETAAPMTNAAGDVTSVTLVATDVSESTSLRRQLDQTRRDYERLFAAVPCFICVQDRDHRIIEANSLYRKEFGVEYGSRCWEVCKKRHTQCPNCIVDQTFADGRVHTSEEVLVTRDGRRINAVVHTRPVLDDDGSISAVMEVFTDITEVKQLERQLSLMGRAVAGMAHRVKNILMGLEGGIFVVNTGLENDDRQAIAEGWEMVERNVQRVSRIVKDLLYCSKERPPRFEQGVSLHTIAHEVCGLFAERIAEQGIELKLQLGDEDIRGTYDPEGLHNLLSNLVANAIDACRFDPSPDKERHTITVRCRSNGDGAGVLEVEDNGVGIPDEMNSRVFEEFFSSKGTEGTGIGLLVVQKVAEEHGGKANFRSSPGTGTTFTITLPASTANTASKTADA